MGNKVILWLTAVVSMVSILWPLKGSQVIHVMDIPPANFQLATPFRSRLRVRHWTDRQTDEQWDNSHHCIIIIIIIKQVLIKVTLSCQRHCRGRDIINWTVNTVQSIFTTATSDYPLCYGFSLASCPVVLNCRPTWHHFTNTVWH